jgi:hypothetical protein
MSGLPKIKSGTQRDSLARYAIMARKAAEQRARKGKKTLGPLHEELSAKLFKQPTKKYQKNQPLIAKVEVIDPATIFKKRIVKTIAPRYGEEKLDVLGSEQLQQKERIESQRKYQELLSRSKGKSHLAVSQAAPGRTRRKPNIGGKKKRRRTIKKRKRRKTRKKRKRRKRRSHQK